MENGGDNRPAGVLLAAATGAVWMAGPAMIGFIPVCLVGALIFLLGIELLEEALWDTFGKCHKLEYITIIAIVLIMGVYDFVVGIFAGIVLACLSYVVLSSRTPAVRATYSGDMAESTVRRPRADRRYLSRVRSQIRVIKLTGFLFFGTIVSVEAYMRSLIEEDKFQEDLTSFIIVDFAHVTDVDFSSSEGFLRINRILARKHVKMIISGISFSSKVGLALQNVGLFDVEKSDEDCPPPRVYEDLNMALEACENELLESFYIHQRGGQGSKRIPTPPKAIAESSSPVSAEGGEDTSLHVNPLDPQWQSPRRGARYLAAETTMREQNGAHPTLPALSMPSSSSSSPSQTPLQLPSAAAPAIVGKWKNISQPLKIILQTFEGVSSQGIDFWHLAAPSFERVELKKGTVLYHRGEMPDGFYVLESGRFRAEYEVGATNAANNNNKSKEQGHGHRSSNDTFGTTSSSTSTSPKRHMRKSKHTVNPRDAPHASFYETILPGTTCGELPFFSETPRTGTVIVEEDSVAWKLSTEKFLELERREPAVGRELVRVGLRLTKERLDGVVGFVYGVVGGGGA